MRGICTACGYTSGLEGFAADPEWREAVLAAASLPSNLGKLVVRYVGLFRPGKRALSPARSAKLFCELNALLTQAETTHKGRTAHIPTRVWQQSLQIVLDAPDLQRPLKNHRYLLSVAFAVLDKRTDDTQGSRTSERAHVARSGSGGMQSLGEHMQERLPPVPLPESMDAYQPLFERASLALKAEGVHKDFMIKPLIEARMRQMIAGADDA